jgi:uncharacterized protein YndB with AHSA1/START domain
MTQLHFEITINRPSPVVFELIADFKGYNRWLNSSQLFEGLMEITENPVKLGTRYTDKGTSTVMQGSVTVYEPPTRISFHQETHYQLLGLPAGLGVTIDYTLRGGGNSTYLQRDVKVETHGLLKLAHPIIINSIRAENERILQAMKATLENPAR